MKRLIYLIGFFIIIVGCQRKSENYLYHVVMADFIIPDSPPLILKFSNGRDTIICRTSSYDLYEKWNIKTMNEHKFKKMLYKKIISNEPIEVNYYFFDYLKEYSEVKVDSVIEELYNKEGIQKILDTYIDENNNLYYVNKIKAINYKYIIYLCFINGYYFFWDDEDLGLFLLNSSK